MMTALPRVGLILTGGTIDSVGIDRLDLAWYIEANKRLGDGELLEPASGAQEHRQRSGDSVSPPAEPSAGRRGLARSGSQDPFDLR